MLSSLEVVHIAPFYHINEVKDEVYPDDSTHIKLQEKLKNVETNLELVFSLPLTAHGQNPPQSVAEAIRVCQNERANYLLYGYIAKREYTTYAELKMLDYQNRSLIHVFYAVDDLDNFERLLDDLTIKILSFVEDNFNLNILNKEPKYTEWWAYGKLGYWTPIGKDWTNLMIGTGIVDLGVKFVPSDRLFVLSGFSFDLSVGLGFSYQFGLGNPDRYEAFNHILTVALPVRLRMKLNAQNALSIGAGLLYTFDLLQFTDTHDDSKMKVFRSIGNSALLGYDFRVRENISLCVDNQFEFHYYEKLRVTYSLRLGVDLRFSKKEVSAKW